VRCDPQETELKTDPVHYGRSCPLLSAGSFNNDLLFVSGPPEPEIHEIRSAPAFSAVRTSKFDFRHSVVYTPIPKQYSDNHSVAGIL